MNFVYRSINFKTSVTGTEMLEMERDLAFWGKPYKMKQANFSSQKDAAKLIYRGIRYTR